MRTEYQKNIVNNLEYLDRDTGFDWSKLGELLVEGGLPKTKPSSRFDPSQFFALAKNNLHDDYEVQNIPYTKSHRFKKKKTYREPIDVYHHPRYISLEYLRDVLKSLQKTSSIDDDLIFKIIKLKKKISTLEYDLALSPGQIVLPGTYYRFLSIPHYRVKRHYDYDPYRIPQSLSGRFYRNKALKRSSFSNCAPYSSYIFNDLTKVYDRDQYPSQMTDINYWSLLYNLTISKGPSFVTSFRRLLFTSDIKKIERKTNLKFIVKAFRQHLQQIRQFKDLHYYKRSFLVYSFPSYLTRLKDFFPYMTVFFNVIENISIYSVKSYWRSLSLAESNRKYILAPSKSVPDKYAFKVDINGFTPQTKKKKKLDFEVYEPVGSALYDIGRFNLVKLITVGYKQLHNPSAYSEVPTAFTPFWTKSARTKRRVRLKDTNAGQELQDFRNSLLTVIKSRISKGPIYVVKSFNHTISEIALNFLNYDTRHHYRIRSENSPYSTRERRLHRLLITQGVLFDYWEESPTLLSPGQCYQVLLQNLYIDKELEFKLPVDEDLTIDIELETSSIPTEEVNYKKSNRKSLNPKLKGKYLVYMKLFTFKKHLYYIIGSIILFLKRSFRRIFFEIGLFFSFFSNFFSYLVLSLIDLRKQLSASPFFLRIQAIIAIWNTSSAIEDSMFDINDHLSSKFEYRRPFEAGVTENLLPSIFELDYVDFDDDNTDEYEEIGGSSRLYTKWGFWLGFMEFGEDFWDEIVDFFVVNLPYYIMLFFRPIINLLIIYPIWSVLDLLCLLYVQIKNDSIFFYDSLLQSKLNNNVKRAIILIRWFFKSTSFIIYTVFWLLYLDYNELQLLIVYTFDTPFHEFYYTIYVMLVVLSGFYLFGHHSFKTFIKEELGIENLIFLTTCTGSVSVQGYEVSPKPFLFSKEVFNHVRPKHTVDRYIPEHFTAQIKNDSRGVGPAQVGSSYVTGQPLTPHFSYDNLEFSVEAQLWSNNTVGMVAISNPRLLEIFAEDEYDLEHPPTDLFDDSWYIGWLVSDLDSISTKSKSLKTPLTWYNNSEHYYNYHSYNRAGLNPGFTPSDFYGPDVLKMDFFEIEKYITPMVEEAYPLRPVRPGRLDPQTRRLDRAADPALFSSENDEF